MNGFCDCHVHVVGELDEYPQVADRTYTASVATLKALESIAGPVGVSKFVIVQASFYGTDNSCLLRTLETLGPRGRGVAAIDQPSATPSRINSFYEQGVCGVRLNFYSTVSQAASPDRIRDVLTSWIDKLPRTGWHIELIAPIEILTVAAPTIATSPIPIVIDHYGVPGDAAPESDVGKRLCELAGLPNVWTKLSAPYRTVADPLATKPRIDWLKAFLQVASDRCVWGSDWPHTPTKEMQHAAGKDVPYRTLDYRRVFGDFADALPDAATKERVLIANPTKLYGFPSDI